MISIHIIDFPRAFIVITWRTNTKTWRAVDKLQWTDYLDLSAVTGDLVGQTSTEMWYVVLSHTL